MVAMAPVDLYSRVALVIVLILLRMTLLFLTLRITLLFFLLSTLRTVAASIYSADINQPIVEKTGDYVIAGVFNIGTLEEYTDQ